VPVDAQAEAGFSRRDHMSAIADETGALSFDLRPPKRPHGIKVRANRRPARPAIDNQGINGKEVVASEPHC
jgi:hypothetical protein